MLCGVENYSAVGIHTNQFKKEIVRDAGKFDECRSKHTCILNTRPSSEYDPPPPRYALHNGWGQNIALQNPQATEMYHALKKVK